MRRRARHLPLPLLALVLGTLLAAPTRAEQLRLSLEGGGRGTFGVEPSAGATVGVAFADGPFAIVPLGGYFGGSACLTLDRYFLTARVGARQAVAGLWLPPSHPAGFRIAIGLPTLDGDAHVGVGVTL